MSAGVTMPAQPSNSSAAIGAPGAVAIGARAVTAQQTYPKRDRPSGFSRRGLYAIESARSNDGATDQAQLTGEAIVRKDWTWISRYVLVTLNAPSRGRSEGSDLR